MALWTWATGKLGAYGIRQFLNREYGKYGQMTQLKIDNTNKTIDAELMLSGETEPIRVRVAKYVLHPSGDLEIVAIEVSRPWMNLLAQDLVAGKPLPLPSIALKWLRMVL